MSKRVLILQEDLMTGQVLREGISGLGLEPIGPILGAGPAFALIGGTRIDVALLASRIDGKCSSALAATLAAHGIPFVVTAPIGEHLPLSIDADLGPVLRKPSCGRALVLALQECGIVMDARSPADEQSGPVGAGTNEGAKSERTISPSTSLSPIAARPFHEPKEHCWVE